MTAFMVGSPVNVLKYFRTFVGAISYWNYMVLGPGRTDLQNLGIDPAGIEMYELEFTDETDPVFMKYIGEQNKLTQERRACELQKSFDEVSDGPCQKQRNNSKVLVKAISDPTTNTKDSTGGIVRDVEKQIGNDSGTGDRTANKKH